MVAVNAWRGEAEVSVGKHSLLIRCEMNTLATLLDFMKVETLLEVYQKWDGLNPIVMQQSLELLAENPAEAKAFWVHVNGLAGLRILHTAFYQVVSGQTPDEVQEAQSKRKKLEAALQLYNDQTIDRIIEVLPLIESMNEAENETST